MNAGDLAPAGAAPRARSGSHLGMWLGLAAVSIAVARAISFAWTSDDAYITFRYAQNLIDGHGLVYNAGERVEGYTNFLWTLWSAVGMALHVRPEPWANAWSIACFAGAVGLLAWLAARRPAAGGAGVPIAALMLALHPDAAIFATSGLETAAFTFLVLAGFCALLPQDDASPGAVRRAALAGLLLALATLTRPDGAVFAATGAAWLMLDARRRGARSLFVYLAVLAAIGIPYAMWKLAYYGDLLPNTWYAKSGGASWWEQGWVYVRLYFAKYPVLLVGPVLALVARARGARSEASLALLAAGFALPYIASVMRVGGDFMFARFLIPVTPLLALAWERGLLALLGARADDADAPARRAAIAPILGLAGVVLIATARDPFAGTGWVSGIVNERAYYESPEHATAGARGRALRELAQGLPLRVAIGGAQARDGYESGAPVVIEAGAGLTDAYIAHLPLARRGRVGHEKQAPLGYLIDRRRVHLQLGTSRVFDDSVRAYVPVVHVRHGALDATVLTWDPPVMDALRRRGAAIDDDFLVTLDQFIAELPAYPDSVVSVVYEKARRFYFAGVKDPLREAPFLARLRR